MTISEGNFGVWIGEIRVPSVGRHSFYVAGRGTSRIDFEARVQQALRAHQPVDITFCLTVPEGADLSDVAPQLTMQRRQAVQNLLTKVPGDGGVVSTVETVSQGAGQSVGQGAYHTTDSFLTITPLDMPTPLGDQLLKDVKDNAPEVLNPWIFGDAPQAQWPASGPTPWHSYAVLEAARHTQLVPRLAASGLRYQSLYGGKLGGDTEDTAPYLVALEAGNTFTHSLFTDAGGVADLWPSELGIYLRAPANFETVRACLRRFTRVQSDAGNWQFFRFYDPLILLSYLRAVQDQEAYVRPWFTEGPMAFVLVSQVLQETVAIMPAQKLAPLEQRVPVKIDLRLIAQQHALRAMVRFATEHDIPFDLRAFTSFDYDYRLFTTTDLHILVMLHLYFQRPDPYDPLAYPEASADPAKAERLIKLLFYKEQSVPYDL